MPNVHFTDLGVRSLKPGLYFDDVTPAFGLRVGKTRKTWLVVKGDRAHRSKLALGHYPALPLSEARKKALIALGSPYAPKEKTVTFAAALPLFLDENYRGKKPRTRSEAKRLLERLALSGPIGEISDQSISKALGKLLCVPSEQLHAFRVLRTMLRWCTRPPHRYITHSPLEGYAPPSQDVKGTRVLTDAELVKIWNACEGQFGSMIRLLILWGTRNGETARTKRTWIADGILTIPGEFTKNGRAHSIPLLAVAQAILADQRGNTDYFFPGHWEKHTHFNDGSWGKLKNQLAEKSGVKNWQIRDIRRTFRSNMAKLRVSRELSEVLLNHVTGAGKNDLDEIYNRYDYLDEKREALAKWEAHLKKILEQQRAALAA